MRCGQLISPDTRYHRVEGLDLECGLRLRLTARRDDDPRPFGGEDFGGLEAQAGVATGDRVGPALQFG